MWRLISSRFFDAVIALFGVTLVVFLLVHLSGDPALLMLPMEATPEDIAQFREAMGFDDPLYIQYLRFLKNALQGDFGESLRIGQPAFSLVLERLPATLELTFASIVIAVLIGVPAGILAATRRYSSWDTAAMGGAVLGQAVPVFWLGIMLILLFGVTLRWFPTHGRGTLSHLVLPALALSSFSTASIARLTRSAMLETLEQDYVRTAWSKGLPGRAVIFLHALRNAMIPVVTIIGIQFGTLLGGAVITETIFAWPGVGRLVVQAVYGRDFPVVQAVVVVVAGGFVLINLLVDIIYIFLDPRIRYQ